MPRKKVYAADPKTDPIGFLEKSLLPKALIALDEILRTRVRRDHSQFVRSLTIRRAAAGTVINGYVALKTLGIQTENNDKLKEILERIKKHDSDRNNHPLLDEVGVRKLREVGAVNMIPPPRVPVTIDQPAEEDETEDA